MTDITESIPLIANLGFPVFVAVWLLFRSDKRTEEMTKALIELKLVINKIYEDYKNGSNR